MSCDIGEVAERLESRAHIIIYCDLTQEFFILVFNE